MKFQVLSDIHLEFPGVLDIIEETPPVLAPNLALLGDIGYPSKKEYQEFVLKQSKRFERVFLVAGNHEYYKGIYEDVNEEIAKLCATTTNVFFMNKIDLWFEEENTVVLGTTLWSNIPEDVKDYAKFSCNDYRQIYLRAGAEDTPEKKRKLTPDDQNEWHKSDVEWLKTQIEKAKQKNFKVVVFTHHAPTDKNTLLPEEQDQPFQYITMTNLEHMLGDPVNLWCFGHSHRTSVQMLKGTKVASNQLGYVTMGEKDALFDPFFMIDSNIDSSLPRNGIFHKACKAVVSVTPKKEILVSSLPEIIRDNKIDGIVWQNDAEIIEQENRVRMTCTVWTDTLNAADLEIYLLELQNGNLIQNVDVVTFRIPY